MKKIHLLLSAAILLCLSGCTNFAGNFKNPDCNVKITLCLPESFSQSSSESRSAFPNILEYDLNNLITEIYYSSKSSSLGTLADTTNSDSSINLALPNGIWYLTAKCYTKNSGNSKDQLAFQSSKVQVEISDDKPTAIIELTVNPITSGSGSIALTIQKDSSLPEGYYLSNFKYKLGTAEAVDCETNENTPNSYSINETSVSAGTYDLEISFDLTNNSDPDSGIILCNYLIKESVTVYSGLITNTWYNTGSSYLKTDENNDTSLVITEDYLKNNCKKNYTVSSEDDLSGVFAKISCLPAGIGDIKLYVKSGSYDCSSKISVPMDEDELYTSLNVNNNLTIAAYDKTPGDGKGNVTIINTLNKGEDASNAYNFIYVKSAESVSLYGITLDGGAVYNNDSVLNTDLTTSKKLSHLINLTCQTIFTAENCKFQNIYTSSEGGAIYTSNSNSTSNISNCTFTNSTCGGQGGGFIYAKGTVNIENSTFTNGKAIVSHAAPALGYYGGGAIYINSKGVLSLTNCTIRDCSVTDILSSAKYSYGGGILINYASSVTLNSVTIDGCIAQKAGNCIYCCSSSSGTELHLSGSDSLGDCYFNNGSVTTLNELKIYVASNLLCAGEATEVATFTFKILVTIKNSQIIYSENSSEDVISEKYKYFSIANDGCTFTSTGYLISNN